MISLILNIQNIQSELKKGSLNLQSRHYIFSIYTDFLDHNVDVHRVDPVGIRASTLQKGQKIQIIM